MYQLVKYAAAELVNAVFPARCMGCLREGVWLCYSCRSALPRCKQLCLVCKRDMPNRIISLKCRKCRSESILDGLVSAGPYGSPLLRRGIHWLKFKGVTGVADSLALMLIPKLIAIAPIQNLQKTAYLVPMPLHSSRERQRGFNQSLVLAKSIEKFSGIPVWDMLLRVRRTWTQTKLPNEMRADNVTGAFLIKEGATPDRKNYLIVDDVTTSGSTLTAAAKEIKKATINKQVKLWGVTAARG